MTKRARTLRFLGGGSNDEDNMNSLAKAVPALVIFGLAVIVRAGLEFYVARHPGPAAVDFSWVTTFAAIAASWLGLGAGISTVLERLGKVERNTNGKSDSERTAIAREAAEHVLANAQQAPVIVTAVPAPASPDVDQ